MPGFKIENYDSNGPPNTVETARSHRWFISKLGPVGNENDIFIKLAKEMTLPTWKVEQLNVLGASLNYKFAKNVKWEDITITFYDTISITQKLEDWRNKVHKNDTGIGNHGISGGYKDTCEFTEVDGKGVTIRKVTLNGSWPSTVGYGKLSYADSSIKLVELTLTYDYAEIEDTPPSN